MKETTVAATVLKWVPLIVVFASIVGSYITLKNEQANANDRLGKVEVRQLTADVTNTQILVQLSAIQSDLGWIREKLKSIK